MAQHPQYREFVFGLLRHLQVLDGLDRNGQPAATASATREKRQTTKLPKQQQQQEQPASMFSQQPQPQPQQPQRVQFARGPAVGATAAPPVGAGPVAGAAGSIEQTAAERHGQRDNSALQQELWRLQVQYREHEEMFHQVCCRLFVALRYRSYPVIVGSANRVEIERLTETARQIAVQLAAKEAEVATLQHAQQQLDSLQSQHQQVVTALSSTQGQLAAAQQQCNSCRLS